MSPKSLVLLVVVGLCATQMASAHREARSVADLMAAAKNKLSGLIGNAEDAARISVETVKKYINKVETQLLTTGTEALAKAGFQIDLNDVAGLLKDNVKICAKDETVKADAKVIINNVASCVTKDVAHLKSLITEMQDLWKTAQDMPAAIQDVSGQCSAHAEAENPVEEEPLELETADADSHDLAVVGNEVLEDAKHHLSKRALWGLSRIVRCVKSVYSLAKNDLVTIPGSILTAATHAFQVAKGVQGGIPACVTKRLAENSVAVSQLSAKLGSCVLAGVSEGEDLEKVLAKSPSLAVLKQLAGAADKLNQISDSELLSNVGKAAKFIG